MTAVFASTSRPRASGARGAIAWPKAAAWAAFAIVLVGIAAVARRHQPWFDEAQSWLIARDAAPWTLLSHVVRYEGTPGLWPMLLYGLQQVGLTFQGLWLVSMALCAVGAALVLFRSPFPVWLRVGLALSYYMAFQYAVVARSYALDAALLPLLAVAFPGRRDQPLIYALLLGLLANANAHSFVICAPLGMEFAWTLRGDLARRRKAQAAVALCAIMALAAVLQAWPPADASSPSARRSLSVVRAALLLSEAVIDRVDFGVAAPSAASRVAGLAASLIVVTWIGVLCAVAGRKLLFWGVVGGFLVFTAVQFGNVWHAGVLWLALVFLAWICWDACPRLSNPWRYGLLTALGATILVQDVETAKALGREATRPYSGGQAAALALKARLTAHPRETVAALGDRSFAVQPWFPGNLFVNYRGGPNAPAYYLWSTGDAVPFTPSPLAWDALLTREYDWALVGDLNRLDPASQGRFDQVTARHGYCLAKAFPGDVNWKGYAKEPDTLDLYGRCARLAPGGIG